MHMPGYTALGESIISLLKEEVSVIFSNENL
jgi:hypothetical protein